MRKIVLITLAITVALMATAFAAEQTAEMPPAADDSVQAVIDHVEKECVSQGIRLLAPEKAKRLAELLRQAKPRLVVEC